MSKKTVYITISIVIIAIIIAISVYFIAIKVKAKDNENTLITEYLQNQSMYKTLSVKSDKSSDIQPSMAETNKLVGVLSIPSLGIKAPVIEGLTPDNLKYAIAHFSNSAIPGQAGNAAFAGNDAFPLNIFENLNKIQMGSLIDLNYEGKDYQYRVSEKQSETNGTSFLTAIKQTKQSTITLVEYSNGTDQILQVEANLV